MIWDILGHLMSKNQTPQFFCNSSGLFLKSRNDFRSNVAGCLILKNDMNISLILKPKLKKKGKTD